MFGPRIIFPMDINTEESRISANSRINKKTVSITVISLVVIIGVFLGVRYSQYRDYLRTPKDGPSAQDTSGLSAGEQKELDELDRLRAEYQAIFGTSATTSTEGQIKSLNSSATTTVADQIKSLDALRKKAKTQTQTTSTIEQQLSELDALRAQAQATAQ